MHRSPVLLQRGSAQTPASQPPLQQSLSAVQRAPLVRQAAVHVPLLQASPEQHSASLAHAALALAQPQIPSMQLPEQQSVALAQPANSPLQSTLLVALTVLELEQAPVSPATASTAIHAAAAIARSLEHD